MKNEILEALKTAYAKLGLSDEAFDGVASLLEKTVKEESEIATAVSGDEVKTLLKTIQGQVDSWKNKYYDANKKATDAESTLDAYKKSHPDNNPDSKKPEPDNESDLEKRLKALEERALAAEKKADDAAKFTRVKTSLEEKCTDKSVLKYALKGFAFKEDESEEDAIARVEADYNSEFKDRYGNSPIPPVGDQRLKVNPDYESGNKYLESLGLIEGKKD